MQFLEPRGWFELLLLVEPLFESLVLNLQKFAVWIDVFVLDIARRK